MVPPDERDAQTSSAPEASAETPPQIAQAILERRRSVLLRRLPARDRVTLGYPPPTWYDRSRQRARDFGTPVGAAALLTGLAFVLSAHVARIEVMIWVALVGVVAAIGFNNALYLRARRLHARQEAARLEYERATLPNETHFAISRVEKLLERLDRQERLLVQNLLRNLFLATVLLLPVLGAAVSLVANDAHVKGPVSATVFELLAAVGFVFARNRARELEGAVQQVDYELSLLTPSLGVEQRAERLYLKQQFELKRYYDEALRQSATLSYIGAGCLAAGFAVIGVTFALLATGAVEEGQIAVAVVGGAGSVLANFVAVVFLRMHSGTIRALTEFQNRLVATNHLHFANLLVARIGSDGVANEQAGALAHMGRAMSGESVPASLAKRPEEE